MLPKILVFSGSLRSGSYTTRLAGRAVKEFLLAGSEVTWISLNDYALPLYDADLEAKSGVPDSALKLKRLMTSHEGIFIVTPEYNASMPPLLKNVIDWVSRARERNEAPLAAFRDRVFALGAASERPSGGVYALLALRQTLTIGCGALVIPEQIALGRAADAFDTHDDLKDERDRAQLQRLVQRLLETARELG
ncbi:MAG TPA: NAD(P)H-dependent oxidoreductase [Xanthobacteraceae bacterium]|nr:NAD(P)H-dependent oxidoreductase [Xanthobacteraceae bacterium]